jgi:predicted phage terminase large subunit-like protein
LSAHDTRILPAAKRLLKIKQARRDLIAFTELTMPSADEPENVDKTRYDAQYFHRALAEALQKVEAGEMQRLIITFPPRHGKSELTSRRFPAWLVGRDPYRSVMLGAYNQDFANDFGGDVRDIILSPTFQLIFPDCKLKKGSKATDRLGTTDGGKLNFVGRGGSATGRGADFLIIDDPFKDSAEARSQTIRDEVWDWFNKTLSTRLMSDAGSIIIIQTRWHEDDLVGRLTDPTNPHYNAAEAALWKIIDIKAIADEDDILGREPGAALWPTRFGVQWLEQKRASDPVGFSALYQQEPTPADGVFFKAEHLFGYKIEDRPPLANLRIYAASDHAVGLKQRNDFTCLVIVGVDADGVIWLLDCWWQRKDSEAVVEAMLNLAERWKPLKWWAEKGHITQALGPFLRRRMKERGIFFNVIEQTPAADKMTRAQSIQGRSAMGMVRFPTSASWTERAKQELLKFPQGRNDDFVDAVAHVGLGLGGIVGGKRQMPAKSKGPAVGTFGWVKHEHDQQRRREKRQFSLGGM